MKLNKQAKQAISAHFVQVMRECGIPKKVFAELVSRFNYDDSNRDWSSTCENWNFQPCLSHGDIQWFTLTLTSPESMQFNFAFFGKPHCGDNYIILGRS